MNLDIHHTDGNHRNPKVENLTAIHCHCHDRIQGSKGNLSTQLSTPANGQSGPDERRLSRPVREPSMGATSMLRLTDSCFNEPT